MRVFIAIELPEAARAVVRDLQPPLARVRGVRFTRPEQFHITLKFLGEIEAQRVPPLLEALGQIRERAFELFLTDLGTFPNARRPRIVWVGVAASPELERLAQTVDRATSEVELDQPFKPHVTLARIVERGVRFDSRVSDHDVPPCRFTVSEFVCYESVRGPAGAKYEALRRFALQD